MRKIGLAMLMVLTIATTCYAWDPTGMWGIEGRTDAKLKVNCLGNACSCSFQSAYGKFEATGYVKENKLLLVYNYLTKVSSNSYGFLVYERINDNRMVKKTLDPNGKVVGTDNWFRQ
ncbi:MAG: hypothetical protein CVU61_10935 [Deltaproteobacteria bacterium HGW-Deltaproteobacteria-19]|jgi:hypothetical protein|nr:MAG: hypothetical protein CVU61_10935 [Deltaproteobacteria bacterium HGW-Deltaproteobacteria-19]